MDLNPIVLAIPFFFFLMGVELVVNRLKFGTTLYRFADSITNLSCGVGQQVLGVFLGAFWIVTYSFAFDHLRVATIPSGSFLAWIAVFFGVDLCYYVFHRVSHRSNLFWAAHVVHHQSEEYNLSVALRQAWFQPILEWVFYIPLAVLGFPLKMFLLTLAFNTLYQFWIHTRAIGTMGPAEYVFNTPMAHRVHHAVNPRYLDKNYAGVFVLWDRLFGTYEKEVEAPVYGTVKPLASFNPLWANVHYWVETWQLSRAAKRPMEKLWAWIAPPEWRPAELGGKVSIPEVTPDAQRKYGVFVSRAIGGWVAANYALLLAATTAFLFFEGKLGDAARVGVVVAIVATAIACGALFERRRWAVPFEVLRLAGIGALAVAAVW